MFLICVLKLIPCYQREEHLHVLPAHSPKTWSRKLPEANINIKLKICRTSLFTGTIRLLLSLSPVHNADLVVQQCKKIAGTEGKSTEK